MITIDKDHIADMLAIEQTLYAYCDELDSGASRIENFFTEDCTFVVGETTWKGHAGLRQHYDEDARAVKALCKDGVKTVRHAMLNLRIQMQRDGTAAVKLLFLNFSAGGHGPFVDAASPTVVADTRLTCKRDATGQWRIHDFHGKPLFFGVDPYMNTVLSKM
jgi:hypothetical protein